MNKAFTLFDFEDRPSVATPLASRILNRITHALDTVDTRVVTLDESMIAPEDIATVIKNVTFDDETGIFTFTKYNDSTITLDTKLEKVVTNWHYNTGTQKLELTLADGTIQQIDLSSLIAEYDFTDSATIVWTVVDHKAVATIKGNSIGDAQMQTGYLTDCQTAKLGAESARTQADLSKLQSEGFAVGEQNGVPVTSASPYYHNNSKYYMEQASAISAQSLGGLTDVTISGQTNGQALIYNSTSQKWENQDIEASANLTDLNDVAIDTPENKQVLAYNSTTQKWENETVDARSALSDLTDTNILSASNNQVLTYNSSTQKWENKAPQMTTVVNNLTSTSTTNALSAYQGNRLSQMIITATNLTVAVSAWRTSTEFTDFGYEADISISGCTSTYIPDVTFGINEATNGKFAPIAKAGSGKVTIYASEIPSASITVLSVVCRKAVS